MQPNVRHGDLVEVAPIFVGEPERGDIVLARSRAGFRLHRVVGRDAETGKIVTRGDAGQQNDDPPEIVLGRVISIERNRRKISLETPGIKIWHAVRAQTRRAALAVAHRAPRARFIAAPFVFLVLAFFLYASPAAAQADLQTTVDTGAPTTVAAGGQITYTITVINNGPNAANTPSVTDTTPANTTFVSMANDGWNRHLELHESGRRRHGTDDLHPNDKYEQHPDGHIHLCGANQSGDRRRHNHHELGKHQFDNHRSQSRKQHARFQYRHGGACA